MSVILVSVSSKIYTSMKEKRNRYSGTRESGA
jgi:hypothetical protein